MATSTLGLLVATGARAEASGISANTQVAEAPNPFVVTATGTIGGEERLEIIDDDSGEVVRSCSAYEMVCAHQQEVTWDRNEDPKPFHFHSRIRSGSDVTSSSNSITIDQKKVEFHVEMSGPDEAPMPGSFNVTATADRAVPSYSHRISIYDDETGTEVARCDNGSQSCTNTAYSDWIRNGPGTPFRYHAEIQFNGKTVARSDNLVVPVQRKRFAVSMGFSLFDTDYWNSAAYTSPTTAGTGLTTLVEKSDGTVVARCNYYLQGEMCPSGFVGPGIYRTRVVDGNDFDSGRSAWYKLDHDGIHNLTNVDGVDLVGVAGLFASPGGICDALTATNYPGTHTQQSSVSDQLLACTTAAALAGATTITVIQAVDAADPGDTVIPFLQDFGQANHDSGGDDPDDPPGPRPIPVPPVHFGPGFDSDVDRLLAKNPVIESNYGSHADAVDAGKQILRRCQTLRDWAAEPESECLSEPIFLTGDQKLPLGTPEATNHDFLAIRRRPVWGQLNYEPSGAKNRQWKNAKAPCDSKQLGQDCDEYPFLASRQGGGEALPQPSLSLIDGADNQKQGSFYGGFLKDCLDYAQDAPFLVVPAPRGSDIPTMSLCN